MEYTDWFPPEIKPVRNGLYLVKYGSRSDCWHMAFWNGSGWYGAGSALHGRCTLMDLLGGSWGHNDYHWRGLTAPVNG